MTRFYPIYARRSDGKLEVVPKGRRKERNEPTEEQLDQKPDKNGVSDFYREVLPEEGKHMDWRRKLGGMLAREMEYKDKSKQLGGDIGFMLVAFPENYRLYEHVKKTEKDGKLEVKSKTHAAGGNDRQDAYLYGHPIGRKKRYRSPADFFPHLLWLCTDESGDPDNCSCKACQPDEADGTPTKWRSKSNKAAKTETNVKPAQPELNSNRPTSIPEINVKEEAEATRPAVTTEVDAQRQFRPSPLPQPVTTDQQVDRQYRSFMYRSGELTWFRRGSAWGLGVITRRWITTSKQHHYSVQPLSHPFNHPPSVVKSSELELRPWLAWSVPQFTNDELNKLSIPARYETVDWDGLFLKRFGNGDLEVDGSILAAKMIDSTFTPFMPSSTKVPQPGQLKTHYRGIFLGAEKISIGDPLRLKSPSGTDMLVLHDIVETQQQKSSSTARPPSTLVLVGDIYQSHHISHSNLDLPSPASPQQNPDLPPRLTEDLAYRNALSIRAKRMATLWKLATPSAQIPIDRIKGRWYEASLLLPILQPNEFQTMAAKGEIPEASLYMNARGDCVNSNRPNTLPQMTPENSRRDTRREALGQAVPPSTVIVDGIDPPSPPPRLPEGVDPSLQRMEAGDGLPPRQTSEMLIDPRFDSAEDGSAGENGRHRHEAGGGGLDEFMNLDGMDEHSGAAGGTDAFGADFGGQNGFY